MSDCTLRVKSEPATSSVGSAGVYLALTNDPQSTAAWAQGSRGERLLGEYLEKIQDEEVVVVLHDRRIPGTRANIDHVAVTRSGVVWAIDAKNYTGKGPTDRQGRLVLDGPHGSTSAVATARSSCTGWQARSRQSARRSVTP